MKSISYKLICVFCIFMVGSSVLTQPAFAESQEKLVIAGTGSSVAFMQIMGKAFQKEYPQVTIQVLPSIGSTGAIKAVAKGKIDIGLTARPLKPEERHAGIVAEPYGRTAFLFATQDSNPSQGFTQGEIVEIYERKRPAWPDGTPIRLIMRPLSDEYSTCLAMINPGLKTASDKAHAIPGVFIGVTDHEAAALIEKTHGSFGVTSSAIIAAEKRKIKALSVDGIFPTLANVSSGKYSYTLTMSVIYARDNNRTVIKDFLEFIFSAPGQKVISEYGHVKVPRITGR